MEFTIGNAKLEQNGKKRYVTIVPMDTFPVGLPEKEYWQKINELSINGYQFDKLMDDEFEKIIFGGAWEESTETLIDVIITKKLIAILKDMRDNQEDNDLLVVLNWLYLWCEHALNAENPTLRIIL